jgi:hypothetical protein
MQRLVAAPDLAEMGAQPPLRFLGGLDLVLGSSAPAGFPARLVQRFIDLAHAVAPLGPVVVDPFSLGNRREDGELHVAFHVLPALERVVHRLDEEREADPDE